MYYRVGRAREGGRERDRERERKRETETETETERELESRKLLTTRYSEREIRVTKRVRKSFSCYQRDSTMCHH